MQLSGPALFTLSLLTLTQGSFLRRLVQIKDNIEQQVTPHVQDCVQHVTNAVEEIKGFVQETDFPSIINEGIGKSQEVASDLSETIEQVAEQAAHKAEECYNEIKDKASQVYDDVVRKASESEKVKTFLHKATKGATTVCRQDPPLDDSSREMAEGILNLVDRQLKKLQEQGQGTQNFIDSMPEGDNTNNSSSEANEDEKDEVKREEDDDSVGELYSGTLSEDDAQPAIQPSDDTREEEGKKQHEEQHEELNDQLRTNNDSEGEQANVKLVSPVDDLAN